MLKMSYLTALELIEKDYGLPYKLDNDERYTKLWCDYAVFTYDHEENTLTKEDIIPEADKVEGKKIWWFSVYNDRGIQDGFTIEAETVKEMQEIFNKLYRNWYIADCGWTKAD